MEVSTILMLTSTKDYLFLRAYKSRNEDEEFFKKYDIQSSLENEMFEEFIYPKDYFSIESVVLDITRKYNGKGLSGLKDFFYASRFKFDDDIRIRNYLIEKYTDYSV